MDLNPVSSNSNHRFNFDFQVWRPSPTVNETGCYSLVDNFMMTSLSSEGITVTSNHVARVTPSPQDQLQFQPGDVLGFYVESHGYNSNYDNGVVVLDSDHYTSELVWHASVSSHTVSGSCPYPVGTDGVLKTSTRAAPVISIATLVYSCTRSPISIIPSTTMFTVVASRAVTASGPIRTMNKKSLASTIPTLSLDAVTSDPKGTVNSVSLIIGTVVALGVLCIAVIFIFIVTATFVKRRRTVTTAVCTSDSTSTVFELSNPTYGKLV